MKRPYGNETYTAQQIVNEMNKYIDHLESQNQEIIDLLNEIESDAFTNFGTRIKINKVLKTNKK